MRHDPSFRFTLRLSERATAADLFLREDDLSKSWPSMVRAMSHEHYSTVARGSAGTCRDGLRGGLSAGRSELSAARSFLCSWHAPRRLLLHADRANISKHWALPVSRARGPSAGIV